MDSVAGQKLVNNYFFNLNKFLSYNQFISHQIKKTLFMDLLQNFTIYRIIWKIQLSHFSTT